MSESNQTRYLLEGVKLGDLHLKNRFILAPLTRCRADKPTGVPNELMQKYYTERTQFGLIISEASSASELSNTFNSSGNLYTQEHAEGWKKIVDAVHAQGTLICIQIWHGGRSTTSSQINGSQPVAPSAKRAEGFNRFGNEEYQVPHALTIPEIQDLVGKFRRSAELAKWAGFDAVELHCANGYLIDQFINEASNERDDEYGGSIENRCRLPLQIIDEFIQVFGAGRVGARFSPAGRAIGMHDSNPLGTMKYMLSEIEKRNLAFVELRRYSQFDLNLPLTNGRLHPKDQIPDFFGELRRLYSGNIIGNDSISLDEAQSLLSTKTVEAISFGVLSIRNPNLPELYEKNIPVDSKYDSSTFYSTSEIGYTVFPDKETIEKATS